MLTLIIKWAFINVWNRRLIWLDLRVLWRRRIISTSTTNLYIILCLISDWLLSRFNYINDSPRKVPRLLAIIVNYLVLNIHNCITVLIFLFFFTLMAMFLLCVENSDDLWHCYGMWGLQLFFNLFVFHFLFKTAYTCLFNRTIHLVFVKNEFILNRAG